MTDHEQQYEEGSQRLADLYANADYGIPQMLAGLALMGVGGFALIFLFV